MKDEAQSQGVSHIACEPPGRPPQSATATLNDAEILLRQRHWIAEASRIVRNANSWHGHGPRVSVRDPIGELLGPDKGPRHPAIDAVRRYLARARRDAIKHSRRELSRILAGVAERFSATIGEIFLLDGPPPGATARDRRKLRVVAAHNVRPFSHPMSDPLCIVAHVARTNRGYFTNDVKRDLYFREDHQDTRSELCVPIVDPSADSPQAPIGVANLESTDPLAFNQDDLERLSAAIGEAVPHLLVLKACSRRGDPGEWIPWCPDASGWDLTELLRGLCHEVADAIEPGRAKVTVWYHDEPKKCLFVYATNGYDIEYECLRTFPVRLGSGESATTVTGNTVLSQSGTIWSGSVDRLTRRRKGRRMGLKRYLSFAIDRPSEGPAEGNAEKDRRQAVQRGGHASGPGVSALNVYFPTEKLDTRPLRRALLRIARLIGHLTTRFDKLRQRYLISRLHYALYHKPKSSESDFGVVRDVLREVFSADGLTIWGILPKRSAGDGWVLPEGCYVVENGTTGLTQRGGHETPARLQELWQRPGHDRALALKLREELTPYRDSIEFVKEFPAYLSFGERQHAGYTRFFAEHPVARTLRINNFLDDEERLCLSPEVPQEPSLAYVEDFPPREDEMRRMLIGNVVRRIRRDSAEPGQAIAGQAGVQSREVDSVLGVIRILKRPETKPFTRCDESLLSACCRFLWKQFLDWEGRVRLADEVARRLSQNGGSKGPAGEPEPNAGFPPAAVEEFVESDPREKVRLVARAALKRLSRPLPLAMRSTGTLLDELVRDLALVCRRTIRGDVEGEFRTSPVKARLLVRNSAFPSKLLRDDVELRTHASFSQPDRGIEDEDPADYYQELLKPVARHLAGRRHSRSGADSPCAMSWQCFDQVVKFTKYIPSSGGSCVVPLSGYCIPMRAWSNGGLIEALLAIEIDPQILPIEQAVPILFQAACRLGAIWGVADRAGRDGVIVRPELLSLSWNDAFASFRKETASAIRGRIYSTFERISKKFSPSSRRAFYKVFGEAPVYLRNEEIEVEPDDPRCWTIAGEELACLSYARSPFPTEGDEHERESQFRHQVERARINAVEGNTDELRFLSYQLAIRRIGTEADAFGVKCSPRLWKMDFRGRFESKVARFLAIPLPLANKTLGYLQIPNIDLLAKHVRPDRKDDLLCMLSEVLNDVYANWCQVVYNRFGALRPELGAAESIQNGALGDGAIDLVSVHLANPEVNPLWRSSASEEEAADFKTSGDEIPAVATAADAWAATGLSDVLREESVAPA